MSRLRSTGLVLAVVLAVLDLAGLVALGTPATPPVAVVVAGGVLGAVTLAAAVPAWRGRRRATATVVVSRLLSALLGIPAFVIEGTPGWAMAIAGAGLVLGVLAAGLLTVPGRAAAGR